MCELYPSYEKIVAKIASEARLKGSYDKAPQLKACCGEYHYLVNPKSKGKSIQDVVFEKCSFLNRKIPMVETFANFKKDVHNHEEAAKRFCRQTKAGNLILSGLPDSGKTYLAKCCVDLIKMNGGISYLITAEELRKLFVSLMRTQEVYASQYQRYINCDLLVIDHLGGEHYTNSTTFPSQLDELLDKRSNKKNIITTTLTGGQIWNEETRQGKYSASVKSRILSNYTSLKFEKKSLHGRERRK